MAIGRPNLKTTISIGDWDRLFFERHQHCFTWNGPQTHIVVNTGIFLLIYCKLFSYISNKYTEILYIIINVYAYLYTYKHT